MTEEARTEAPLNDAQRALVQGAKKVAERAAYEVARAHGMLLPLNEMMAVARMGIVEASRAFDPEYGVPFAQYAFFRASGAILDAARRERRFGSVVRAARRASSDFLAHERAEFDLWTDTNEDAERQLTDFASGLMASMLSAVAVTPVVELEEDLSAREQSARAQAALARAVDELEPSDREIIQAVYGEDEQLKEMAKRRGVSYVTMRRAHQKLKVRLGKRLEQLGVTEAPPRVEAPGLFGPTPGTSG